MGGTGSLADTKPMSSLHEIRLRSNPFIELKQLE